MTRSILKETIVNGDPDDGLTIALSPEGRVQFRETQLSLGLNTVSVVLIGLRLAQMLGENSLYFLNEENEFWPLEERHIK